MSNIESLLSNRRGQKVVLEPKFELSVLTREEVEMGSLFPSVCLKICKIIYVTIKIFYSFKEKQMIFLK